MMRNDWPYINGTVWERPWPLCHSVVLTWMDGDKFALLVIGPGLDTPTNLMPITFYDAPGQWLFTLDEIRERTKDWVQVDRHVALVSNDGYNCREVEETTEGDDAVFVLQS